MAGGGSGEAAQAGHSRACGGARGDGCWKERGALLCHGPRDTRSPRIWGRTERSAAKELLPSHCRDGENASFNSFINGVASREGFPHCMSSGVPGQSWFHCSCWDVLAGWPYACKCFEAWEGEWHRGSRARGPAVGSLSLPRSLPG